MLWGLVVWVLLQASSSCSLEALTTSPPPAHRMEPYSKFRPGRRVCTSDPEKTGVQPVRKFEAYRKPTYQSYAHRCHDKICRGVRVVYETAYRDVTEIERAPSFHCCPGWTQQPKTSHGCITPVCSQSCMNGGTCTHPETCACLPGFTGLWCQDDVDECRERTPCSHLCTNTAGTYRCSCREGFRLAPDLHSCHRKGRNKTIDGKFDVEILARKLTKLEKMWRKSSNYELQTELSDSPSNEELQASLESLHKKLETMNRYQEDRWTKIEERVNRLLPICNRIELLERRMNQCGCKCKDKFFPQLFP